MPNPIRLEPPKKVASTHKIQHTSWMKPPPRITRLVSYINLYYVSEKNDSLPTQSVQHIHIYQNIIVVILQTYIYHQHAIGHDTKIYQVYS